MLDAELRLLFNSVDMVIDEAFCRRNTELGNAAIVKLVDSFVESLRVNSGPLLLQLLVELGELVLD